MNIKRFTLLSLLAIATASLTILLSSTSEGKYFPKDLSSGNFAFADGYLEFMQSIKANKETGTIDPKDVFAAVKQADRMPKNKASLGLTWKFRGPDNIGGRTRAILIDKNNPDHLYAGGVTGGVFESFDAAVTWQPYDPDFEVNNISCITQAVDGSVYVGTGGHFEGASNRSNTTGRGTFVLGSGVHKLTGNGTFQTIIEPTARLAGNIDFSTVGEIVADPVDNNRLHVAMNNGYRVLVLDPNSGNVIDTLSPINPQGSAFCTDIDISQDGQHIVVTYTGSIHSSTDGGITFTESTPTGGPFGRIECDIAPSDKNIVYAGATFASGQNRNCLAGVFRSQDGGKTWERIAPPGTNTFDMYRNVGFNCQGTWDNLVKVYPDNSGKILVAGIRTYRWEQSSVDPAPANGSWNGIDITFNQFAPIYVHADKHDAVFDPRNSDVAYIVSDGGVTKSTNMNDEQPTFRVHNFKYGVTQYYGMDVNGRDIMLGGTQDNGSHLIGIEFNNDLGGIEVQGGDGFDALMSKIDPSIGVASLYYNAFTRIQGIGTSTGNSNLSGANIVSTNSFLDGNCNNGLTGVRQCSDEFYTTLELWESFDHVQSTDSVEKVINRTSLPPIPKNTVIAYESNNNDLLRFDTIGIKNGFFDTTGVKNGQLSSNGDLYPVDTLIDDKSFEVYGLSELRNGLIVNYDTIFVDTSNMNIFVRKFEGGSETKSFTYGNSVTFDNAFGAPNQEQHDIRVSLNNNSVTVRVKEMEISFTYVYYIQDKIQSILASANWPGINENFNEQNVFITRDLTKSKTDIVWHHVAGARSTPDPVKGTVLDMAFSNDGDHLFMGSSNGNLYRVSGLNSVDTDLPHSASGFQLYDIAQDSLAGMCKLIGSFGSRAITSISVDPNNSDNLVVALGNYGNHPFVYRTDIATTAQDDVGTFDVIEGNGLNALPRAPAYSILIDKEDNNKVLIGTEFGVFATDNAFTTNPDDVEWTEENLGVGRVPVFEIRQIQFNYGDINRTVLDSIAVLEAMLQTPADDSVIIEGKVIYDDDLVDSVKNELSSKLLPMVNEGSVYIATHGRGMYRADQLVSVPELSDNSDNNTLKASFKVFPNPASDIVNVRFKTENISDNVNLQVFTINGKIVREERMTNILRGENTLRMNLSNLEEGTYLIRIAQGDQMVSSKVIKR